MRVVLSYYSALRELDLTMGMETIAPRNLVEAAGRLAGPGQVLRLLCRAAMTEGVQSERCHGGHMPRLDLPGAHKKFTDHMIRIVKANEQYPD